tara:strand:+ start:609 stop:2288 length:1680 start_codon:yes stop_codon:yes gene_type:complete
MATTDLMVGIGAEYKGRGAFKKADKDILGLQAGVKSLAKAYIGLAGAQKAFRYSLASVKAFAEDDLAIQKLSRTLDNLGLAYEQTNVENFIAGLERTYHVADDLLRPAFSKLVQVTQSYTKSKQLLTAALNASAGAGVDLNTTVSDLSQAYVGNLKGLKKYNLGLTNAELATMTFEQILEKLSSTFSGQASLAADTYAGKINALTIASGNAKEVIGQGITDAIIDAFGNGELDQAVANMEAMAKAGADLARSFGTIAKYSGIGLIAGAFDALRNKRNELATKDRPYDPMSGNMPDMSAAGKKLVMDRKKADAEAAKRQKQLAAMIEKSTKATKAATAAAKAKAILDKAGAVTNMDLIQNTAALMGKVSEEETLRLKLQQAILLGNADEAGNLAQQLLAAQGAAMLLAGVPNPLDGWTGGFDAALKAILALQKALDDLGKTKIPFPLTSGQTPGAPTQPGPGAPGTGGASGGGGVGFPGGPDPDKDTSGIGGYLDAIFRPGAGNGYSAQSISQSSSKGMPYEVKISIDPSAAAYGINAAVVASTANGNQNQLSRTSAPWQ